MSIERQRIAKAANILGVTYEDLEIVLHDTIIADQPVEKRLTHAERVMDALYHDLDNAVYSVWGCEAEHHRPTTESDYQEYKRLWGVGRK